MGRFISGGSVKVSLGADLPQSLVINQNKKKIKSILTRIVFADKNTNQIIMYIPALDISGYGSTEGEAKEMLDFSVDEFYEYLIELPLRKIQQILSALGWKRNKLHNKEYSNAHVDVDGVLKNFNPIKETVKVSTIAC